MLKKLAVFLLILCVAMGGLIYQLRFRMDRTGPEIYLKEGIVYNDNMTEEDLLKDVVALDERDGDVSDTLTVESVYRSNDEEATIIYAAKDKSNNISKRSETVKAEAPAVEEPEPEPVEEAEPETPEEKKEEQEPAVQEGPTAEQIAAEEAAKAEQEAAADAMAEGCPRIYLNTYIMYVKAGEELSYKDISAAVKKITDDTDRIYDLWSKIQISDLPDVSTPGTYETKIYVTDSEGNTSNKAVLKFVVE